VTPDQYCEHKAAPSGSSLYYSVLFLPPDRRRAFVALHALWREFEDAVNEVHDADVAQSKLVWWRKELAQLGAGHPTHPVTQALAPHLATTGLTPADLIALLNGIELDLAQTRYLDFPNLRTYCERTAGLLAQLSARLCGFRNEETPHHAVQLGLALRLMQIVRDVGDDARKGRIYLPVDDLQRFNVPAADIMQSRHSDNFVALMRFQAERARATCSEALRRLPPEDRRAQRPALIMSAIALALLDEVEADRFQVLHQRISLTPLRKLWIAWKTQLRA
jgi:phytoene synthase